jgi:hypothetical protein
MKKTRKYFLLSILVAALFCVAGPAQAGIDFTILFDNYAGAMHLSADNISHGMHVTGLYASSNGDDPMYGYLFINGNMLTIGATMAAESDTSNSSIYRIVIDMNTWCGTAYWYLSRWDTYRTDGVTLYMGHVSVTGENGPSLSEP